MAEPLLSVMIPTHNRKDFLRECVESVRVTRADCEIVVLDNASSDETPQMMESLARTDPRIRYIRNESNIGTTANYNKAMKVARGKYICLLGDDDAVLPGNFEKKLALLEAHPQVGLVYSQALRMKGNGEIEGTILWPGILTYSYLGGRNEWLDLLPACYISLQSVVFRQELYKRHGGMCDEVNQWAGNDWDMLLRFCSDTKTAYIAEPLVCVRYHSASNTESVSRRAGMFAEGRLKLWRKWLVENNNPPVLDEAVWQRMFQAFLPDLRWEFGDDAKKIEAYLHRLQELKQESVRKIASRFTILMSGVETAMKAAHAVPPASTGLPIPAWWSKLWHRLQPGGAGTLRWVGKSEEAIIHELENEGWKVLVPSEKRSKSSEIEWNALAGFGEGWQQQAGALKVGGLFLIAVPLPSTPAIQFRESVEKAFDATVHLLDPEADCGWLFAFGWKGRRIEYPRRSVLMVAHQRALEIFGGGETQLFETLYHLREEGVQADVSLSLRLSPENYDLLHLFSLFHADKRDRLRTIQSPMVVSTIFWDYAELRYATAVVAAIFAQTDEAAVQRALDAWREGTLQVQGLTPKQTQEPPELRANQRAVLDCARILLPNGEREMQMVRKAFGEIPIPWHVVPNGVRPERFLNADPKPFVERFGLRDFVLCAARIEPNKNQAMLIWALRGTGLPLVLAGRESDTGYAALCRKWSGENVHFVGELNPDMLASAYAAARVHALPSWSETPGLVNLEAGLAGCSLVVGDRGTEQEYLGEFAFVCNPADYCAIRSAVMRAWEDSNPERAEACRQHILQRYRWQHTAQVTAEVYESVLSESNRWFVVPRWDDALTWQPVIEAYLRAGAIGKCALLSIYAGSLTASDPNEACRCVEAYLRERGVDANECPDIEITNELPNDRFTRIVLTGGNLDDTLRQRYAEQCVLLNALISAT